MLQFAAESRSVLKSLNLDANEVGHGLQELEFIQAELMRPKHAKVKIRELVEVTHSVPAWAQTWGYFMLDERGEAQLVTAKADEWPEVAVTKEKFVHGLVRYGAAYSYDKDEIAAASRGMNLPLERALVARKVIERQIDKVGALGESVVGIEGFINHSAVTPTAVVNGDWLNAATTAAEILEDLYTAIQTVWEATEENYEVTDVVIPTSHMSKLMTMPVDTTNQTKLLDIVKATYPGIRFHSWHRLETADVAGTGPRIIAYHKSREVLEYVIAQEYEEEPPEKKNLKYRVPCHIKLGGVAMRQPLAVVYMDVA